MTFTGLAIPLTSQRLDALAQRLACELTHLWAVIRVETSGCGYLPDKSPRILFERHVFHDKTDGRYDAQYPDISSSDRGGYLGGAAEYDRLNKALGLAETEALESASWGIGQVMGFNAAMLGYGDVAGMIEPMLDSEDAQLDAMGRYLQRTQANVMLKNELWEDFARTYNGPRYRDNDYHIKLRDAFDEFRSDGTPDIRMRTAQIQLMYRHFEPGPIDGRFGARTAEAIRQYQNASQLPVTGVLDDATYTKLTS